MSGVEIDKSFRLASVLYGCADSRFFVSLQLDKPWLASKKNIINFVNSLTPSQAESLIVNFIPFVKEEKESLQEQVRRSCCVME